MGQTRKQALILQWNKILRIKYVGVFTSEVETSGAKWKEHTL